MISILVGCLCSFAAWCSTGIYKEKPFSQMILYYAVISAACGAMEAVLYFTGGETFSRFCYLPVFLLSGALLAKSVLPAANAVLSCTTAIEIRGILMFLWYRLWSSGYGIVAAVAASGMTILMLALMRQVGKHLPLTTWDELLNTEDERFSWSRWDLLTCVMLLGAGASSIVFLKTKDLPTTVIVVILDGMLFLCQNVLLVIYANYRDTGARLHLEEDNKKDVDSFLSIIRSQRHDYNFHIQTLSGIVNSGDLEACRNYVHAMERDTDELNTVLPIHDPAIAALIHNFRLNAKREGIAVSLCIDHDLSSLVTNAYETNKVISNLLQNAIEEVKSHQDKSYGVHLDIMKRGEFLLIDVSNQVTDAHNEMKYSQDIFRQGFSGKKGHDGVGLSSVRSLLIKHGGTIYSRMEDDVMHLVAKIPLQYGQLSDT